MKHAIYTLLGLLISVTAFAGETCLTATTIGVNTSCITTGYSFGAAEVGTFPTCASRNNDDGWYTFTATTNFVSITATCNKDLAIGLMTGICGTQTEVACVNAGGSGATEILVSSVTIGQTYYIWLDRTNSGGGGTSGTLCVVGFDAPGGVGNGLTVWLKASSLTGTGSPITSWVDESGNGNTATQGTSTLQPSLLANSINFNQSADFDGGDRIGAASGAATHTFYVVAKTNTDIDNTSSCAYVIGVDCSVCVTQGGGIIAGSCTVSFPDEVIIHAVGNSSNWRTAVRGGLTLPANTAAIYSARENAAGNASEIFIDAQLESNATSGTYLSATNQGFNLGSAGPLTISIAGGAPFFWTGQIAEVINYNNRPSDTEHQKIQSYLAVKYGITLGTTTNTFDYLAANGTTVWAGDATYQNDIAGIARDEGSALYQTQSRSENGDAMVTMSEVTPLDDQDFLLWGNNNLATETNGGADVDGILIETRLSRVWTVQITNTPGLVDVIMDLNSVPGPITGSDLRLMVDADGTFATGATLYSGTYNSGTRIVTFNNVSYADGDFFTLGSIDVNQTPLPVELTDFNAVPVNNKAVHLDWTTATEYQSAYFTLERSADGIEFIALGDMEAAGMSTSPRTYRVVDENPLAGVSYYRLSQTDLNGSVNIYGVRSVEIIPSDLNVYPNPADDQVQVAWQDAGVKTAQVRLLNVLGEEVQVNMQFNTYSATIDTQNLPAGIYFAEVIAGNQVMTERFIVRH